ncbi:alpha-galactosidase [Leifsonia shinshuensis]|uniref:alpha-galactosidase n=1 Tax=Leifsonia shinshuensis TaxID=150026 RepID=UPI001F515511|nr:alpha-galactosidase [Leifsonia shinshuensis]MCI0157770.1 alpha-galactosidase [Leifsonia shinshuensis]
MSPAALPLTIQWGDDLVSATIEVDEHARVGVTRLAPAGSERPAIRPQIALGPVELSITGDRLPQGSRHVDYGTTAGLRYRSHRIETEADGTTLRIVQTDAHGRLDIETTWRLSGGIGVLSSSSSVRCVADEPVQLDYLSSFVLNGLESFESPDWDRTTRLWIGRNTLCGEFQWTDHALTDFGLYDVGFPWDVDNSSKQRIQAYSVGTQPTTESLPAGAVTSSRYDDCVFWQLEHNGSWQWEVGEHRSAVSVSASGPTDQEHQWSLELRPGDTFTSVPASIAVVPGGIGEAIAALTSHRRRVRREHQDLTTLPVVFNDFMNCLQADPSEDKLLPVIDAAARLGCETFCVDAGWYSDEAGWWTTVGGWEESSERFPHGLAAVFDRIRDRGMTAGLWIEPEVIGVDNPLAADLPSGAVFERKGRRIDADGRFQLDFRSPAVVERMDAVIDRLVADYGLGYLKFDYNVNAGVGTDHGGLEPGVGLLGHNRAYLAWVDGILDRHPGLVIESCASGAARADGATLQRHPIASTSDQAHPLAYIPIAAGAATAMPPEQAGIWVLPEPEFTDELLALSVINGLIGRPQVSGGSPKLDDRQARIVTDGLDLYKKYRHAIPRLTPQWPLGLPYWTDERFAYALADAEQTIVAVWRREGESRIVVPLDTAAASLGVDAIYGLDPDRVGWDPTTSALTIDFPDTPAAALVWLRNLDRTDHTEKDERER